MTRYEALIQRLAHYATLEAEQKKVRFDYRLISGDSREQLKTLAENSVDAICTDPPYELTSIVKRFGKEGSAGAQHGSDGRYKRLSGGFMGKTWDATGIGFDPAFWLECLRVLKPGGHLIALGGSRTHHRMWTAIEDAGFEIRDSLAYLYGSGFPKNHNVSKGFDRAAKAEREVMGDNGIKSSTGRHDGDEAYRLKRIHSVTAPATALAKQWDGWGTALKPAMELICLARKPLSEKSVARNVMRWGTGALNIDGCRVGASTETHASKPRAERNGFVKGFVAGTDTISHAHGRWPANLIHDGSDEVLFTFPESASGSGKRPAFSKTKSFSGIGIGPESSYEFAAYDDAGRGSAARFFYCAKASTNERNSGLFEGERLSHPTPKPVSLMRYLCRLIAPPNGVVLDPFMGSGTTGIAAFYERFRFVGIELDEGYYKNAAQRIKYVTEAGVRGFKFSHLNEETTDE